jgi:hypothetical protein
MGAISRKYIDHSNETATVEFRIADLTGDITAPLVAINALLASLEGITLLNAVQTRVVAQTIQNGGAAPADKNAQKEISWTIHYRDTVTGRNFVYSVPGADMTLTYPNSDLMDITTAAQPGIGFVGNFEATVVSIEGNPVEVTRIELKK